MEIKTAHGFKVISSSDLAGEQSLPLTSGVQQSLFPWRNRRSAVFVSLPGVHHDEFVSLLKSAGRVVVVELRKIPRFDFGSLNRTSIFALFQEQGDLYLDLGMQCDNPDRSVIEQSIQAILQDHVNDQLPILFIRSRAQNPPSLTQAIIRSLRQSNEPWDIFELPNHDVASTSGITA
jgi:hypothetical protein